MASFKTPWWQEYRVNKYKPKTRFNRETICRRSLKQVFSEYIKNCSLSGVSVLADKKVGILEGLFRLLMIVMVMSMLVYCLLYVWSNMNKPLVVSMESSTYPISEIDFPAVSICNVNRISLKAAKAVSESLYQEFRNHGEGISRSLMYWYVTQTGRFLDFEYSDEFDKNASRFDFEDSISFNDSNRIITYMAMLAPSCSESLLKCQWNNEVVPCDSLFTFRRTVRGHCCTFNYVRSYNSSDGAPSSRNRIVSDVKRQVVHGRNNGLFVLMDPMVHDYAYPMHPMHGFEIMIFDPTHFPDFTGGRVGYNFVEVNTGNYLELRSRKQLATSEVRKYLPKTRNCLFHDEQKSQYADMYSMSACVARCRIQTIQSLCKCTPFFLPTEMNSPTCSFDQLKCLNKYKEKFLYLYPVNADTQVGLEQEMQASLYCPQCLPDCEHTQHSIKANKLTVIEGEFHKYLPGAFLHGSNMTNKCLLNIYQPSSDGVLDRLDVVYYWYELLSNVGGFGGILVGFSFMSVIEFLYFLCFRFFFILRNSLSHV